MSLINGLRTPPRAVTAVCRFRGGPGRHADAALAWGFELVYYFLRGVGETPPVVQYFPDGPGTGVYVATGPMTTTHPGDTGDPVEFDKHGPGWDLDFVSAADRRARLRDLYARSPFRFDGQPPGGGGPAGLWERLAAMAAPMAYDPAIGVSDAATGPPWRPGEENR